MNEQGHNLSENGSGAVKRDRVRVVREWTEDKRYAAIQRESDGALYGTHLANSGGDHGWVHSCYAGGHPDDIRATLPVVAARFGLTIAAEAKEPGEAWVDIDACKPSGILALWRKAEGYIDCDPWCRALHDGGACSCGGEPAHLAMDAAIAALFLESNTKGVDGNWVPRAETLEKVGELHAGDCYIPDRVLESMGDPRGDIGPEMWAESPAVIESASPRAESKGEERGENGETIKSHPLAGVAKPAQPSADGVGVAVVVEDEEDGGFYITRGKDDWFNISTGTWRNHGDVTEIDDRDIADAVAGAINKRSAPSSKVPEPLNAQESAELETMKAILSPSAIEQAIGEKATDAAQATLRGIARVVQQVLCEDLPGENSLELFGTDGARRFTSDARRILHAVAAMTIENGEYRFVLPGCLVAHHARQITERIVAAAVKSVDDRKAGEMAQAFKPFDDLKSGEANRGDASDLDMSFPLEKPAVHAGDCPCDLCRFERDELGRTVSELEEQWKNEAR